MELSALEHLIDKNTPVDNLSASTLRDYRREWRRLKQWLTEKQISHFGETDINRFLQEEIGKTYYVYAELSKAQVNQSAACRALINYINTGTMKRAAFAHGIDFESPDLTADARFYQEFLLSLAPRLKPGSIKRYKQSLSILYSYAVSHQVTLAELSAFHLARLFDGAKLQHNTIYSYKIRIKVFLKWLFTKGYTAADFSALIPREKLVQDEKLPTTFTKAEVKAILKSIDRGTAIGRRDFAILLCIAAYGFRISDICQLKLEHFNWREQTVSFIQVKTGVPLSLKLDPVVFNAIVDWIKHGRPNASEYDSLNQGELFLLLSDLKFARPIHPSTVNNILYRYLRRAGIKNLSARKHSCHALRFSLATRMIEDGADIRTVKEVLGHKDKSVTFNYVRLDLAGLKQCNLPMVPCQSPFYSDLKEDN